ncbi:MAG: polysaccharide biosynthesis/export family protein [Planctomycetota bacterium]
MRLRLVHRCTAWLFGAIVALCALPGCASSGDPLMKMAPQVNSTLQRGAITLQAGDTLDIRFPNSSEWNHTTLVRPDGRASFVGIDELQVMGLTVEELDRRLTELYSGILVKPELTVLVDALSARRVVVIGEVRRPGEVILDSGHLSLIDALGRAGGPRKDSARLESTLLVRWAGEGEPLKAWKIDARPKFWGRSEALLLQPYDLVFVPNTTIDKIDIFVDKYIRQIIPLPGGATSSLVAP